MKSLMMEEAKVARGPKNIVLQILIFFLVLIAVTIPMQIVFSIVILPETLRMAQEYLEAPMAGKDLMQSIMEISEAIMSSPHVAMINLFLMGFYIPGTMVYCKFIEKRSLGSMGVRKKGMAKHYLLGLLIGFIMIAATFGLSVAMGAIAIERVQFSINWLIFVVFLLGFIFQGASEEFLFRGYLMNTLGGKCGNKYAVAIAVFISSVMFGLGHVMNPGVTFLAILNIVIYGVFMGIYMIVFDNIWGVCGIHTMWNFAQGNIFGISVSGSAKAVSIVSPALTQGKTLLNGGSFGLEGSLLCTAILVVAVLATLLFQKARSRNLPQG